MVAGVFSVTRELPRLREISSVLIRHGLGDLVRRVGVAPGMAKIRDAGVRMALLASGVLAGVADALRDQSEAKNRT